MTDLGTNAQYNCDPDPCTHGDCVDLGTTFECHCKDVWEGKLCENGALKIYVYLIQPFSDGIISEANTYLTAEMVDQFNRN